MGLLRRLIKDDSDKEHFYPETNISLKKPWSHPYWLKKYGPLSKTSGPVLAKNSYPFYRDSSRKIVYYSTDSQENHSACWLGDPRMSGKSTGMNYAFYNELVRGAKGIMFDPKGEYPLTKWPGIKIKKVGIDDFEKPFKFKPSLLTAKDWEEIVKVPDFNPGRERSHVSRLCRQASLKLSREGKECTINSLEQLIKTGEFGGYTKGGHTQAFLKETEIFFENLRMSELFDEDDGIDFRTLFDEYDCLILDMSMNNDLIPLVVGHLARQIIDFKRKKPTTYNPNPFHYMKLIIGADEAGSTDFGIYNQVKRLSCLNDCRKFFTYLPGFNVVCMYVTQYPASIDTNILGATKDKFLGRLEEENAIRKLASNANMAEWELKETLPKLRKGQFLLANYKDVREVVKLEIPKEFIKKRKYRK